MIWYIRNITILKIDIAAILAGRSYGHDRYELREKSIMDWRDSWQGKI